MKKSRSGFTIVELLIVIVVIAILAAISIVAYNGILARARDAQRKTDLSNIAKALHRYNIDFGNYAVAGCGNGAGNGWFDYDYDGAGPNKTSRECLSDAGYIPATTGDPSGQKSCGGATCHAYIKWTCASGTYIYANLETLAQDSTASDGTCEPGNDTSAGINYVLRVN